MACDSADSCGCSGLHLCPCCSQHGALDFQGINPADSCGRSVLTPCCCRCCSEHGALDIQHAVHAELPPDDKHSRPAEHCLHAFQLPIRCGQPWLGPARHQVSPFPVYMITVLNLSPSAAVRRIQPKCLHLICRPDMHSHWCWQMCSIPDMYACPLRLLPLRFCCQQLYASLR